MDHLIPITRTNRLLRLSRDGRNVIWVPDVREDIGNWREMGHRRAWLRVSAHGKTAGSGMMSVFSGQTSYEKFLTKKPCIGREYFAYPRK